MQPDSELLDRVLQRDSAAFEVLMARHRPAVVQAISRIVRDSSEAQDLAQEVFLRVWTRAEQWSGAGTPEAWVLRIAANLALNHLRSVRRRACQPLPAAPATDEDDREESTSAWLTDAHTPSPPELSERAERRDMVSRLLGALPEEKREVLKLVFEQEMSLAAVAQRLGIPLGTVKSRLHYAVKALAQDAQELRHELED